MTRLTLKFTFVLCLCLLALSASRLTSSNAATTSNWPQWRGPDSQGISTEKNLPTEWSDTKNVLWKTPIPGLGYSQPIIWEKKVFLTTAIEGGPAPAEHKAPKHMIGEQEYKHPDWYGSDKLHTFKVLCLDRDSGKVIWDKTSYEGPVFDHRHRRSTYAGATPVTDGKLVVAYFGPEGVYCYDFSGKLLWQKNLGGIDTFGFGTGTSPILYNNLVILVCDQSLAVPKGSFMVALDKTTGKEIWRVARPIQGSWFTPVIVTVAGRTEMITSGNEFLISYDPATGKELWRTGGLKSHAIATPIVGHGLAILSSGFPSKVVTAVKLGGSGNLDGTEKIAWRYSKGTAYVPSPILYGDYVYLMSDAGILTCLNAKTGEVVYEGGRVPIATKFYGASPVAFEDKLLLTSDDGDTFVIKAGPKHEVLGTNSLGEPCRTSIAIADGKLFIRGEKNLFCIGKKG
ncbi:MAG: PQQ-like beta-propeller repeat protein [Acidobacteria bacterium]|nr:PQQ-like beta-propeller repeat protein [Acidobacteriota bacterium]MBI3422558.1 PQQ-like beta-propeller repeat protein [Acidobacteriota bacterium]